MLPLRLLPLLQRLVLLLLLAFSCRLVLLQRTLLLRALLPLATLPPARLAALLPRAPMLLLLLSLLPLLLLLALDLPLRRAARARAAAVSLRELLAVRCNTVPMLAGPPAPGEAPGVSAPGGVGPVAVLVPADVVPPYGLAELFHFVVSLDLHLGSKLNL